MSSSSVCGFCGKPACEAETLVSLGEAAICTKCIVFWARECNLVSGANLRRSPEGVPVRERLPITFTTSLDLDGLFGQKYDTFLLLCLIDVVRCDHWDVSIELAQITRWDGFKRRDVAAGQARYRVDLMVRATEEVTEEALRHALEGHWQRLTHAYSKLLFDKGTRDLVEPRLASLAAYVIGRAAESGQA